MGEYPFVNIRIDICKEEDGDSVKVYEQRTLIDFLKQNNPDWLAKIIANVNNLEKTQGE